MGTMHLNALNEHPGFGVVGIVLLFLLAFLASERKGAINLRIVLACFALQVAIAVFVLYVPVGKAVLAGASAGVTNLLSYANEGIRMVFGQTATDPEGEFVFLIRVLPVIVFFAALMEVLYHLRVMPFIVRWGGQFIRVVTGTRPVESLNVVANIFVGQTEAPLSLKPYLASISRYELFAIMVAGLASIAGSVLAGYIAMGIPAEYLIAAAFMSAPAALMFAKIIVPEPKEHQAMSADDVFTLGEARPHANVLEAAATGAQNGTAIAIAVGAMLIAFVSLIALLNGILSFAGSLLGFGDLSVQYLLGWLFAPIMWALSIPWEEARIAGAIFGEKVVLNEFIAFLSLSGAEGLSDRSRAILAFAVCGFANFASIGILLGGLGTIIPQWKSEIARLGLKAVFAASLANLMSAALAGLLLGLT
jgi:concentrative nucleoside transporter, CNT family